MENLEKMKELVFQVFDISENDKLRKIQPQELCYDDRFNWDEKERNGYTFIFNEKKPKYPKHPLTAEVVIFEDLIDIQLMDVGDDDADEVLIYLPNEKKIYEKLMTNHVTADGDIEVENDEAAVIELKNMIFKERFYYDEEDEG